MNLVRHYTPRDQFVELAVKVSPSVHDEPGHAVLAKMASAITGIKMCIETAKKPRVHFHSLR